MFIIIFSILLLSEEIFEQLLGGKVPNRLS